MTDTTRNTDISLMIDLNVTSLYSNNIDVEHITALHYTDVTVTFNQ